MVLAWRDGFVFDVPFMDHSIIHIVIKSDPVSQPWCCSFVYVPNLVEEKVVFWDNLAELGGQCSGPWMLLGDFNMVQSSVEQSGGRPVRPASSFGLSHLCKVHGLIDLGFSSGPFTWSNQRQGRHLIRER